MPIALACFPRCFASNGHPGFQFRRAGKASTDSGRGNAVSVNYQENMTTQQRGGDAEGSLSHRDGGERGD